MERLGDKALYPKLDSCVYSTELPLVNAPMTWPRIGGNWWGPRILAATGPEQENIICSPPERERNL